MRSFEVVFTAKEVDPALNLWDSSFTIKHGGMSQEALIQVESDYLALEGKMLDYARGIGRPTPATPPA